MVPSYRWVRGRLGLWNALSCCIGAPLTGCTKDASAPRRLQDKAAAEVVEHAIQEPTTAHAVASGVAQACVKFGPGRAAGRLDRSDLTELSGLVASRQYRGMFYVHNDSGDRARFFSMDSGAHVRTEFVLVGGAAFDWEDIALGPGPAGSGDWLYLADTGDNASRMGGTARGHVEVIRVAEPDATTDAQVVQLSGWQTLLFTYPDHPHDAEAIALDARTGDLFFVTKEDDGRSQVLVARAPQVPGPRTLEPIGRVDFSLEMSLSGRFVTAMDIDASATTVILRTYSGARLWRRQPGQSWKQLWASEPLAVPLRPERQGEGIAFAPGSLDYYTISEGVQPILWHFEQLPCP